MSATLLARSGLVAAFALAGPAALVVACSTPYGGPDEVSHATDATSDAPVSPPRDAAASDGGALPDADSGPKAGPPPCGVAGARACNDRYLFTTSTRVPADFSPSGSALAAADALCRAEADAQPMYPDLHGRAWRAWLCTSTVDARSRLRGPVSATWSLPEGRVVFASTKDVADGVPTTPLGPSTADSAVWTGCNRGGLKSTTATCSDWSSKLGYGLVGNRNAQDARWSSDRSTACAEMAALFCFEDAQ
ncbi:MAG: hypothetical protein JWP97_3002 [Labilithrix sp.]|nr:hypothetical protein [Labilithrix sp.]